MGNEPKYSKGMFIFRRDFRLNDNIGLIESLHLCKQLYTCFIFTPEQVSEKNKFKSNNAVQFMIESLEDLEKQIHEKEGKLLCFYGKQEDIVEQLIKSEGLDYVGFNRDYSPYAKLRDETIKQVCDSRQVICKDYSDYYLQEPGSILVKSSGQAYKKYTPFYNEAITYPVTPSMVFPRKKLAKLPTSLQNTISLVNANEKFVIFNPDILVHGGRKLGMEYLKKAIANQQQYLQTRDYFPKKTSHLSAYIKFGCVSIREVYHGFAKKYGKKHGLISELFWREFFAHVLHSYPNVVGAAYQEKYRNLDWENDKEHIKRWKEGKTGFPLVDAAMREMNKTGYMHNRGRMTAASVLIKTLRVDWRIGEQYFAQKLTDYDIASNNGNWQGISGTGVDMKPYFRDMNPYIQSEKFDQETEYIKQWVPELKDVPSRDIHRWNDTNKNYPKVKYPAPIVDYKKAKEQMLKMYEKA